MFSSIYVKLIIGYFTLLLIIILGLSSVRSIGSQENNEKNNTEFTKLIYPIDLCRRGNLMSLDCYVFTK